MTLNLHSEYTVIKFIEDTLGVKCQPYFNKEVFIDSLLASARIRAGKRLVYNKPLDDKVVSIKDIENERSILESEKENMSNVNITKSKNSSKRSGDCKRIRHKSRKAKKGRKKK